MSQKLHFYSMSEFAPIIFPILEIVNPKNIVEIGVEYGTFAKELISISQKNKGKFIGIDPAPKQDTKSLFEGQDHAELIEDLSLNALKTCPKGDAYFIDGDHNYYTVKNELDLINEMTFRQGETPILFLHDVGWPCAKRDQYYQPDSIPQENLHEYSYEFGVLPGSNKLVVGGMRGKDNFAYARKEGGPENGVLTAVEDFLKGSNGLEYRHIPVFYGLGVIFHVDSPWAKKVDAILMKYHNDTILEVMEKNRLDLYHRIIELQDYIEENIAVGKSA